MPSSALSRPDPQFDFLVRMRERHAHVHGSHFLTDAELTDVDQLIGTVHQDGPTDNTKRQVHTYLVRMQERNTLWSFLNDAERQELDRLIKPSDPASQSKKSRRRTGAMSAGEFITILGVTVSVAAATFGVYQIPGASEWTGWVGFWGYLFSLGFIRDIRHRGSTRRGFISVAEGLTALIIWALAAAVVVVVGGHWDHGQHVGWVAFFTFIAALFTSRAALNLRD